MRATVLVLTLLMLTAAAAWADPVKLADMTVDDSAQGFMLPSGFYYYTTATSARARNAAGDHMVDAGGWAPTTGVSKTGEDLLLGPYRVQDSNDQVTDSGMRLVRGTPGGGWSSQQWSGDGNLSYSYIWGAPDGKLSHTTETAHGMAWVTYNTTDPPDYVTTYNVRDSEGSTYTVCQNRSDGTRSQRCGMESLTSRGNDLAVVYRLDVVQDTTASPQVTDHQVHVAVRRSGAWQVFDLGDYTTDPLVVHYQESRPDAEIHRVATNAYAAWRGERISVIFAGSVRWDPGELGGYDEYNEGLLGSFSMDSDGSGANWSTLQSPSSFNAQVSWYATSAGFRGGLSSLHGGFSNDDHYYPLSAPVSGQAAIGTALADFSDGHTALHGADGTIVFARTFAPFDADGRAYLPDTKLRRPDGTTTTFPRLNTSAVKMSPHGGGMYWFIDRNAETGEFSVWRLDGNLQPPTLTVAAKPARHTKLRDATVEFSSPTATSFECTTLTSSAWSACQSPVSYSGLADGDYSVRVRALNGDQIGDEALVEWTVDTVKPQVSFPAQPQAIQEPTASVLFNVGEGNVLTRCSFNGAAPAPCSSPVVYTQVAEGTHSVRVEAEDRAGNVGEATFTFDRVGQNSCILPASQLRRLRAAFRAMSFDCRGWPSAVGDCDDKAAEASHQLGDEIFIQALDSAQCFVRQTNGNYITGGRVRLNGLTFQPAAGRDASFVVSKAKRFVTIRNMELVTNYRDGKPHTLIPLPATLGWSFKARGNTVTLTQPDAAKDLSGANIGTVLLNKAGRVMNAIPITSDITIGFSADDGGTAKLVFTGALPPALEGRLSGVREDGKPPRAWGATNVTASLGLEVSNAYQAGLVGTAKIGAVRMGPVNIQDATVSYSFAKNTLLLSGRGDVPVRGASPLAKPQLTVTAEFPVIAGWPVPHKAGFVLDRLNVPLAPPPHPLSAVFLQGFGGSYDFSGAYWQVSTQMRFSLLGEAPLSAADPSLFGLASFTGAATIGYNDAGEAFLRGTLDGYIWGNAENHAFPVPSSSVEMNFTKGTVDAGLRGSYGITGLGVDFNLGAHYGGTAPGYLSGVGSFNVANFTSETQVYLADKGFAHCTSSQKPLSIQERLQAKPGSDPDGLEGSTWGIISIRDTGATRLLQGCDIGTFQRNGLPGLRSAIRLVGYRQAGPSAVPSAFTVKRGTGLLAFKLHGASQAAFTRPDGGVTTARRDQPRLEDGGLSVIAEEGVLNVVIRAPKPGTWKLATDATALDAATNAPDPRVSLGQVTGKASRRVTYRVASKPAGTRLQLEETTAAGVTRRLATLKSKGSVAWAPQGTKGRRLLTVVMTDGEGVVRGRYDVGRYTWGGLSRLTTPSLKLRTSKKGRQVRLSWRPQPGVKWTVTTAYRGVVTSPPAKGTVVVIARPAVRAPLAVTLVGVRSQDGATVRVSKRIR